MNYPIAILIADLHLQSTIPSCFLETNDKWMQHMAHILQQIKKLQQKKGVPIICAGDVFDHWNSSAALINFALDNVPRMFSIPGQHDLPNHQYKDISRSAYWTLVKAKVIHNLEYRCPVMFKDNALYVWGFPWNVRAFKEVNNQGRGFFNLAVTHQYVWTKNYKFPQATKVQNVRSVVSSFEGFDAIAVGDNHKGFTVKVGDIYLHNNGTIFQRRSDEMDYEPCVGILYSDGTIIRHELASTGILHFNPECNDKTDYGINVTAFLKTLSPLEENVVDFRTRVSHYLESNLNKLDSGVVKVLQSIISK